MKRCGADLCKVVPEIIQDISQPGQKLQHIVTNIFVHSVEGIAACWGTVIEIARHGCRAALLAD